MAFLDIFKKKKTPSVPDNPAADPLRTPYAAPDRESGQTDGYTITFEDAYTGRRLTDFFPQDMDLRDVARQMQQKQILSFPACYACFQVPTPVRDPERYLPIVGDIENVHSGMTVMVDISREHFFGREDSPQMRRAYPLVFFRMDNDVCVEKIEFMGYGFENSFQVLNRMKQMDLLPSSGDADYRILYWPTLNGASTVEQVDNSPPKMLCEFDPEPGKVLILQRYWIEMYYPSPPLYGCPSAALKEQVNALQDSVVDVLSFDGR